MPKKYDDAELLRVFDETNNGRETARRLGIHANTAAVALRRLRGVCPRCSAPKAVNRQECPICLKTSAARMKQRRKERARLGLCIACNEPLCARSRHFCERHKREDIDYRRRREETRRRGQPNGGQSTPLNRANSIRENYGDEALRCWYEAKGRCVVCDRDGSKVAIHLHHLDLDPANNTYENFACLCFYCHQAVHKLIGTESVRKFVAWFSAKYPHLI